MSAVICSCYGMWKSDSLQILFFSYVIFNRLCKLSFSIETKIFANYEVENSIESEAYAFEHALAFVTIHAWANSE